MSPLYGFRGCPFSLSLGVFVGSSMLYSRYLHYMTLISYLLLGEWSCIMALIHFIQTSWLIELMVLFWGKRCICLLNSSYFGHFNWELHPLAEMTSVDVNTTCMSKASRIWHQISSKNFKLRKYMLYLFFFFFVHIYAESKIWTMNYCFSPCSTFKMQIKICTALKQFPKGEKKLSFIFQFIWSRYSFSYLSFAIPSCH